MLEIIISDTSCLISLNKINCLFLLKKLYGNILITPEVKNEFGENLPEWIKVAKAKDSHIYRDLEKKLDKGEASSIALALELKNSTLIIDELKVRKIAQSFNINIIGTVGLIILAKQKGLISNHSLIIEKLKENGFYISEKLSNIINNF